LRQSIRNLNDGLSLTQTLEGGLSQITSALQRLRELSVQAANETYNYADRLALQAEADQMIGLIDKAVEQTQFNGIKLLDGSARNLDIFVDQPSGEVETLSLGLLKVDTTEMSRRAFYESERRGVYLGTLANGDLKINGVAIRGTVASDDESSLSYQAGSAIAKAKAINSAAHLTGVRARARANVITANRAIGPYTLDGQNFFAINGHQFSGFKIEDFDADGKLRDAINSAHSETGVKAQLDNQGQLQLIAEDGRNIQIKYSNMLTMLSIGLADTSGDETNLKGIVEKSSIETGNPASHASFVPSGSPTSADYFGTIMNVQTTHDLSNFTGSIDVGGSFDPGVENIDYVVQFVEGGALGTAKFRILSETASETNAAEAAEGPNGEDFSFLVVDPPYATNTTGVNYFSAANGDQNNGLTGSMVVAGTYNEAPDREYTLKVVRSGSTDSSDASQRARIEVTTNVDGATNVIASFTVSAGTAHNIGSNDNQTGENLTVQFGGTPRGESVSSSIASGQEYDLSFEQEAVAGVNDIRLVGDFDDFNADVSMRKTIHVVETGYTSQAGNLAKLRVVNENLVTGATVAFIPTGNGGVATFSISADTPIDIGDGLSVIFPGQVASFVGINTGDTITETGGGSGSYEGEQDVTLSSTAADFVGERGDGTYILDVTKAGIIGTAEYRVLFQSDHGGLPQEISLSDTVTSHINSNVIADGITFDFEQSTPSVGVTTNSGITVNTGDDYGDSIAAYDSSKFFFGGNYTGALNDGSATVTVLQEGRVLDSTNESDESDAAVL
jgi:flagellin-like hook-associated protein FlgL